jgi:predicted nucleic acid-binding protein
MILIVDASVAAKWVLPEPDSDRAAALRTSDNDFAAPSLVIAELSNALWKSALRGDIESDQAATALDVASSHFAQLVPLKELARRATALAIELRHPIYDCFYLALAERERTTLISADARLLRAAKKLKRVAVRKL